MRALLVFSVLLLSQVTFAQGTAAAAPAAPATTESAPATPAPAAPAATEEAAAVTVPSAVKKGIFVSPNFSMFKRKVEQQGATSTPGQIQGDVSGTELDVTGGYVFDMGVFAGLKVIYNTGKDTANGIDSVKTYAAGPTVGYHCNYTGLYVSATYNLTGKADFDTLGKYDKVTGLEFDVAYPIHLTETINVGPQLSWRRLNLKDGSNGLADTKTKEFVPSISAWFYF